MGEYMENQADDQISAGIHAQEMEQLEKMHKGATIFCPFCGEHGFDREGFKTHLVRYCTDYDKCDTFT